MANLPKKEKFVGIRLDEETYQEIEKLVIQNKTSISQEIRKMIDYYLLAKEKLK